MIVNLDMILLKVEFFCLFYVWLTSPTGGGRSVGIVRVRTKEFSFSLEFIYNIKCLCALKKKKEQIYISGILQWKLTESCLRKKIKNPIKIVIKIIKIIFYRFRYTVKYARKS